MSNEGVRLKNIKRKFDGTVMPEKESRIAKGFSDGIIFSGSAVLAFGVTEIFATFGEMFAMLQ